MKILINYYKEEEEEFYAVCHLQYINLSYFPYPDTNGSLIHNLPPYLNEKILMKY